MTRVAPTKIEIRTNRQKLVEALESGEYAQGKESLHPTPDTYCCLGVLCAISGLGHYDGSEFVIDDTAMIAVLDAADEATSYYAAPPTRILDRFGLSDDQSNHLMGMNDTEGKTFGEIAEYLKGLPE